MAKSSNVKAQLINSRILIHTLFWIVLILTLTYMGSLFGGEFNLNLMYMFAILPVQMAAAYLLVYWQVPKWLNKKYWLIFIIISGVLAYSLAALARLSVIYIAEPWMGIDGIDESLWEVLTDPIYLIRVYLATAYLPAVLFFLIKTTKDSSAQRNKLISLEKEKQTAELNFLKAQINPHFLFNTLNNIYALAKNKSEETPEMILKLSEILDYTIYECKSDRVPLNKEWDLIENYVDLQALRHDNQLTILLNQQINDEKMLIAPLILISLVENAFKHGLKGKRGGSVINISMTEKNREIIFKIYNTRSDADSNKNGGVGLENIKRQLELQYPNQYTMYVKEDDHSYQVTLSIDLSTHQ